MGAGGGRGACAELTRLVAAARDGAGPGAGEEALGLLGLVLCTAAEFNFERQPRRAAALAHEATEAARRLGDKGGDCEVAALVIAAQAHEAAGEHLSAMDAAEEALQLAQKPGRDQHFAQVAALISSLSAPLPTAPSPVASLHGR